MKKILILVMACFCTIGYASAQKNEYVETVKTYMEVMGSYQAYKAVIPQMLDMIKMQYSLPDDTWKLIEDELGDEAFTALAEQIAPLYERYLTRSDLQAAIDFYQTPVGRKIAEATPKIAVDAMQVGQQWGMDLGKKIEEKIRSYNREN